MSPPDVIVTTQPCSHPRPHLHPRLHPHPGPHLHPRLHPYPRPQLRPHRQSRPHLPGAEVSRGEVCGGA